MVMVITIESMCLCVCMRAHVCMCVHACVRACICACMHACQLQYSIVFVKGSVHCVHCTLRHIH